MFKHIGMASFLTLVILFACKTIKIEDSSAVASIGNLTPVNLPKNVMQCRAHGGSSGDAYMVQFEERERLMILIRTLKDGRQLEYVGSYTTVAQFADDSNQSVSLNAGRWSFELKSISKSQHPELTTIFNGDSSRTVETFLCSYE